MCCPWGSCGGAGGADLVRVAAGEQRSLVGSGEGGRGMRGAVWRAAVLHQLGRECGAPRGLRLCVAQGCAASVRGQWAFVDRHESWYHRWPLASRPRCLSGCSAHYWFVLGLLSLVFGTRKDWGWESGGGVKGVVRWEVLYRFWPFPHPSWTSTMFLFLLLCNDSDWLGNQQLLYLLEFLAVYWFIEGLFSCWLFPSLCVLVLSFSVLFPT